MCIYIYIYVPNHTVISYRLDIVDILIQPQILPFLRGRRPVEILEKVSFESFFGQFLSCLTKLTSIRPTIGPKPTPYKAFGRGGAAQER